MAPNYLPAALARLLEALERFPESGLSLDPRSDPVLADRDLAVQPYDSTAAYFSDLYLAVALLSAVRDRGFGDRTRNLLAASGAWGADHPALYLRMGAVRADPLARYHGLLRERLAHAAARQDHPPLFPREIRRRYGLAPLEGDLLDHILLHHVSIWALPCRKVPPLPLRHFAGEMEAGSLLRRPLALRQAASTLSDRGLLKLEVRNLPGTLMDDVDASPRLLRALYRALETDTLSLEESTRVRVEGAVFLWQDEKAVPGASRRDGQARA
jgi:hypothetical protein